MSHTHRHDESCETRIGCVLDELAANNILVREGIGKIVGVKHAKPNSRLDKKGAKFLVVIATDENKYVPVPLRVKRSGRREREFEDEMNRRHLPHIRSLHVRKHEDDSSIREQILRCLRAAVQLFRNGYQWLFRNYASVFQELDEMRCEERPTDDRAPSSKTLRQRRRDEFTGFCRFHAGQMCH